MDCALHASRKFCKMVKRTTADSAVYRDFTVQNMGPSCGVGFNIRLEGLALQQYHSATYEPELFPGHIFRMHRLRLVLLIFASGKVVFTGAKLMKDVEDAFQLIYPILKGLSPTKTVSPR